MRVLLATATASPLDSQLLPLLSRHMGRAAGTRIARHACDLPGRYAGFGAGRLRPGLRAHLAVLDPTAPWTVRAEELHTKCGWSPFEGVTLPGRVVYTVASGRLFRNGLEVT